MQDYKTLFENKKLLKFFNRVPWCFSGSKQQHDVLKKTLIAENNRYQDICDTKFSIITTCRNTSVEWMEELIFSVMLQSWPGWELLVVDLGSYNRAHVDVLKKWSEFDSRIKFIKREENISRSEGRNLGVSHATGDFVCLLGDGDVLHPQVLGAFHKTLHQYPSTNLIYTNELKASDDCSLIRNYNYKPEFSMAGLRRVNFVGHFAAVSRVLYDRVKLGDGDVWFDKALEGCEDHDLLLRIGEADGLMASHLPAFTHFSRDTKVNSRDNVMVSDRAKRMLKAHYRRISCENDMVKINTIFEESSKRRFYSILSKPKNSESVGIVIPYKDQVSFTISCLKSLLDQDYIKNCDVLLVDNNSQEHKTSEQIGLFIKQYQNSFRSIKVVEYRKPFNFGAMHNWAIEHHIRATYLFFLNNDVELRTKSAISNLVSELEINSDIGFVGMRLMYPRSNKIQFGGFKFGLNARSSAIFHDCHVGNMLEDYPFDERLSPAITFAACMMRLIDFKEMGGFNDVVFPNNFGDVDLCFRGRKNGLNSFYLGTLEGVHHESISRILPDDQMNRMFLNMEFSDVLASTLWHKQLDGCNLERRFDDEVLSSELLPLRYRIADKVNLRTKTALGPFHKAIKRFLR